MKTFHILFIEDDKKAEGVVNEAITLASSKMAATGATITTTHSDNWQEAESFLKEHRYDLVIADLFVFKTPQERTQGGRGGFDCREPLLKITEGKSPPIPVVFYTDRLTLSKLEPYHDRICEFWHKDTVKKNAYFLSFRIQKIRDFIERERHGDLLVRSLRAALEDAENREVAIPWQKQIVQALDHYEYYGIQNDQAKMMTSSLCDLSVELGFPESFNRGMEVLQRVDMPSSTLIPGARPHYSHALNTFLLGYYLFNLCDVNWKALLSPGCKVFDEKKKSKKPGSKGNDNAWDEILNAWFAAATLHDVGIAITSYERMVDELTAISGRLNVTNLIGSATKIQANNDIVVETTSEIDTLGSASELRKTIRNLQDKNDHGFLSATYLGSHCYKEANAGIRDSSQSRFLLVAAEAAGLHNRFTDEEFPQLDFAKNPVAAMLVFCDAIQSWERERPDFQILHNEWEKDIATLRGIAKVELSELMVEPRRNRGPKVSITVQYFLHSFLACHRPTVDDCQAALKNILLKHVVTPLQKKLIFTGPKASLPLFHVDFRLGTEQIIECKVPYQQ